MRTGSQPRTRHDWERLLRTLTVRPSRTMGQNFLVEPEIAERIVEVAALAETDAVLEIGPGLGILTDALASRTAHLVAVELDVELAEYLRGVYRASNDVTIMEQDARYVEPPLLGLPAGYKVVANLPYSSATIILRRLLEQPARPASLTVMVQREVGERMVAKPPHMSLLSIATQLYADARLAFVVPPDVFSPSPRVESAVVQVIPHCEPPLEARQREALFYLATLAFQAKRKTLSNSLAKGLGRAKGVVESELERIGIDSMRRPQTLTVAEWCQLAESPLGERPT